MDKQKPQTTKYFQYQFTKTIIALAIAVIALCLTGIGVSIYRIVTFGVHGLTEALQSPFLIAICAFCIALMISILVRSRYGVNKTHYIAQFGFIKSKTPIDSITSLCLDTDTKKLTVYMGEEFTVLSLSERWQDEFIAALREVKPEIEFTFTLAEK